MNSARASGFLAVARNAFRTATGICGWYRAAVLRALRAEPLRLRGFRPAADRPGSTHSARALSAGEFAAGGGFAAGEWPGATVAAGFSAGVSARKTAAKSATTCVSEEECSRAAPGEVRS